MRRYAILFALLASVGCGASDPTEQLAGIAAGLGSGPGDVTVTARAPDQLAVSWSADPLASQYDVFQSAGGAAFTLTANVFDSSGGPPATSFIAAGLTAGVQYCYTIESVHPDGTSTSTGSQGCAFTTGAAQPTRTLSLAFPAFVGMNLFSYSSSANMVEWSGPNSVMATVPVEAGHVITAFRVTVKDGTAGPTLLSAALRAVSSAAPGNNTVIGAPLLSNGTGSSQTLTSGQLAATTASGTAYYITVGSTGGSAPVGVSMAEIDYN